MPNIRPLFKYWLPVMIWMAVIFTASADTHSYQHSSRLIAPLLYWLFPHISANAVDWVVFVARKCAHLAEYSVFALLVWRALCQFLKNNPPGWSWRRAGITLFIVAFYAASDEFHQSFVAGRTPAVHDAALDTFGGAVGLFAIWLVGRWRKRW